jgi:hypothetical protein
MSVFAPNPVFITRQALLSVLRQSLGAGPSELIAKVCFRPIHPRSPTKACLGCVRMHATCARQPAPSLAYGVQAGRRKIALCASLRPPLLGFVFLVVVLCFFFPEVGISPSRDPIYYSVFLG